MHVNMYCRALSLLLTRCSTNQHAAQHRLLANTNPHKHNATLVRTASVSCLRLHATCQLHACELYTQRSSTLLDKIHGSQMLTLAV
jgi:hypothetical protein